MLELLGRLDAAACTGSLPGYLPQGADVRRMARTVRVLGEVRRGPAADERGLDPRPGAEEHERARMYALPAERAGRAGRQQPWEQLAGKYQQLVVLADPGMGKSWLIRAETHRLALAAAGSLADASVAVEDVLIPVPIRADVLAAPTAVAPSDAPFCGMAALATVRLTGCPTAGVSRAGQAERATAGPAADGRHVEVGGLTTRTSTNGNGCPGTSGTHEAQPATSSSTAARSSVVSANSPSPQRLHQPDLVGWCPQPEDMS